MGERRGSGVTCVACARLGAAVTDPLPPRAAETDKWKKISYVFLPFVVLTGVYVMGTHKHSHWHQVEYPFIKMRTKAMPWSLKPGGSKCDLFDYDCSAKERALKAGVEPAHH